MMTAESWRIIIVVIQYFQFKELAQSNLARWIVAIDNNEWPDNRRQDECRYDHSVAPQTR